MEYGINGMWNQWDTELMGYGINRIWKQWENKVVTCNKSASTKPGFGLIIAIDNCDRRGMILQRGSMRPAGVGIESLRT